jgi:hypothetical protein
LDRVLQVTSDLILPRGEKGDYWQPVVTVFLSQANERLYSIRLLLDNNYEESSVILIRSIFELAVNLVYISKDSKRRLSQYLKHGGIPLTIEEAQQLQQELEYLHSQDAIGFIPRRPWKQLKDMCCDLGSQWLKEYETFYRYVSVPTHAGSFTLGNNFVKLLNQQPLSDYEKAKVMITALDFHLRIADVAAHVFPKQIDSEVVKRMTEECQKLGQSLLKIQ